MKKFILLALSCLLTVGAQAQIVSSRSVSVTREAKAPSETMQYLYVQWNPGSFNVEGDSNLSYNGFSIGYNKAISISSSTPLFIEAGIGLQYTYHSKNYEDYDEDYKETLSLVSLKVPVSLVYNYAIPNSDISLAPYAGIYLRGNVIGKLKEIYEDEDENESYNIFSDDDVDNTCKRFQIGWHVGVNAKFNDKYLVGVSYGADLSNLIEGCKTSQASVTLGIIF